MGTVFVKPAEGALVRMPGTMTPLAAAGDTVSLDGVDGTFWRRRINDGSVTISEQGQAQAAATTESARSDKQRRRD